MFCRKFVKNEVLLTSFWPLVLVWGLSPQSQADLKLSSERNSISVLFSACWTQNLALQQILSSIDLFLFYRTDYTHSRTMLNGCTGKCVRLSRPLVGFWTHFKSLHFHSFIHSFQCYNCLLMLMYVISQEKCHCESVCIFCNSGEIHLV